MYKVSVNYPVFERNCYMNTEDMDYYEYEESKKRFTPKKIIGFIFKLISFVIIAGTFALILGRITLMKIPKAFSGLTFTESVYEAYSEGRLEAELFTPTDSFDDGVKINGKLVKGRYHISNVALSHTTNEVQFTFRYNSRSTINALMTLYELTERPSGEVFVFTLTDNNGVTYKDYVFAAKSRPLYEFRRIIFEGVDLTDVTTLYLNVYYGDDVSGTGLMNHTFVMYEEDSGSEYPIYEKAKKTSLVFSKAPVYMSKLEG